MQVHPNDDYALRVEGEYGKAELWYVVDAAVGAELLYGFQYEITKEEFRRRIEDNTLLDVVRRVPVKKGDVFFIPAGTLHAIGKGILICEIQQNSNTTYRIYDYGRIGADGKPRDLHIEKALDVTRLTPVTRISSVDVAAEEGEELLAACEYFTVYHLSIAGGCTRTVGEESFQCLTALSGSTMLRWHEEMISLNKGESIFLPAGLGRYELHGDGELILSKI